MKTPEIFQENKDKWLDRWMESVISTYPAESCRFFLDTRDPFANPVGATLKKGLDDLYEALIAKDFSTDDVMLALEPMIRLRSVQEFTPAKALGFLLGIKAIMMAGLKQARTSEKAVDDAMAEIGGRVDSVMLLAFNIYMESKKKIYLLRARQSRDAVNKLLIKKGLMSELPDIDPELDK